MVGPLLSDSVAGVYGIDAHRVQGPDSRKEPAYGKGAEGTLHLHDATGPFRFLTARWCPNSATVFCFRWVFHQLMLLSVVYGWSPSGRHLGSCRSRQRWRSTRRTRTSLKPFRMNFKTAMHPFFTQTSLRCARIHCGRNSSAGAWPDRISMITASNRTKA